MTDHDQEPFYVGYLGMSRALRRVIAVTVTILLGLGITAAALLAGFSTPAGEGRWQSSDSITLKGHARLLPYPMLRTTAGETWLLVGIGKIGAQQHLQGLDGAMIDATGFPIRRGGWRMLELPDIDSVRRLADAPLVSWPAAELAGAATITGEIVDSKCFLGVMKPGSGPVHKACASLCYLGGIPPQLMVKLKDGQRAAYLMTDGVGGPLGRSLAAFIAEPVQLRGTILRSDDMVMLRLDPGSIRRLNAAELAAYGPPLTSGSASAPVLCARG